jgi:hypothetical protein
VKYLDSLQLEKHEISDEGTRVSVWTNAMVRKATQQDIKPDGSFGATLVCSTPSMPTSLFICLYVCNYF